MEYAQSSQLAPGASDFGSQKPPQMVPSPHLTGTPKAGPGASPKMGAQSPILQPQRSRGRSWADQLEQSDEDDLGGAQTVGDEYQSSQTIYMSGPNAAPWPTSAPSQPPSRRPPQ